MCAGARCFEASPGARRSSCSSSGPSPSSTAWPRAARRSPPPPAHQVVAAAIFPDLSIAAVQNARLPGSVTDDRQILLGGVGSDLWHGPADPPDELWMVTDRGPRGRGDDGKDRQAFAIPEYTPMILHVRLGGAGSDGVAGVEVLETIPIVGQSGRARDRPAQPRRPRRAARRLPGQGAARRTTRAASIPRGWRAPPTATSGSPTSTARRWCTSMPAGRS